MLFTSIDSSHRFGTARPVPVDGMSPEEASRLLAARLNLAADREQAHGPLIGRLAAGLDYWPLALELAAGYMHSCGYSVTDIPYYLDQLKLRSLDDRDSVPDGYPATLIAAIGLAASRLSGPGTDPVVRDLAADLILEGAYLSSRRIPLHLLASARQPELDSLPGDRGPVMVENPEVHEAVRALGRVSFSRRDQPLPRRETDLPTAEHTISFNSVLQEVIRARAESSPNFPTWKANLERLAYHLDHWLASAGHNGEADKLHALAPHAEVLVGHPGRLSLTSDRIPILIGNLAGFYTATGDRESAADLLRTEIRLLINVAVPNDFHINQARLRQTPAGRVTRGRPVLPCATARRCADVPANAPRLVSPRQPAVSDARPWAVPGAQRPRAGATVPGAGNPAGAGHPAGLWPPSPQLAADVNIRRTLLASPRSPLASPQARTDGSAQRISVSNAAGSRRRYRTHIAAVPRIPGRQPACLGVTRQRRLRPASAVYQRVALSVTASV